MADAMERASTGIRALARLMTIAGLLAAALGTAHAHPFSFDTSRMVGFDVLTAEDSAVQSTDTAVITYRGPITFPMAENLREIWDEIARNERFQKVIFRLNSPGGTQAHGEDVIAILGEMRERVTLMTLVAEHDLCASMCVPLYIQGETRSASPASGWMFHGAARTMSNVPSLTMTMRYVSYFRTRTVGTAFVDLLMEKGYLTSPGEYWLSGSELAASSDIITRLAPGWRPAEARTGPATGALGRI